MSNGLTRPIPATAMPVVNLIRKDVPRPDELPKFMGYSFLHWPGRKCLLGLHPESIIGEPENSSQFAGGKCSDEQVEASWKWWDDQTDAQAAVDAVWNDT